MCGGACAGATRVVGTAWLPAAGAMARDTTIRAESCAGRRWPHPSDRCPGDAVRALRLPEDRGTAAGCRLASGQGSGVADLAAGGAVQRRGPGNGPRQPHLHHAAGGACGRDAVPVKTIHDASPQAVHHFTRFDQVNRLVRASGRTPMGTNPFRLRCMAHTSPGLCSRLYASTAKAQNFCHVDRSGFGTTTWYV